MPIPTPTPDVTGPSITNIAISATLAGGIYYIDGAGNPCGTAPTAGIQANFSDSSGVNTSTIYLRFMGSDGVLHQQLMGLKFGTKNTYASSIANNGAWAPNTEIYWWLHALDNAGNATDTSAPPNASIRLFKGQCIP
jgi:hypothetical protein